MKVAAMQLCSGSAAAPLISPSHFSSGLQYCIKHAALVSLKCEVAVVRAHLPNYCFSCLSIVWHKKNKNAFFNCFKKYSQILKYTVLIFKLIRPHATTFFFLYSPAHMDCREIQLSCPNVPLLNGTKAAPLTLRHLIPLCHAAHKMHFSSARPRC